MNIAVQRLHAKGRYIAARVAFPLCNAAARLRDRIDLSIALACGIAFDSLPATGLSTGISSAKLTGLSFRRSGCAMSRISEMH
jgi:hypothetical protein